VRRGGRLREHHGGRVDESDATRNRARDCAARAPRGHEGAVVRERDFVLRGVLRRVKADGADGSASFLVKLQPGATTMPDDPIKRIPISQLKSEEGAHELASSPDMEPSLTTTVA